MRLVACKHGLPLPFFPLQTFPMGLLPFEGSPLGLSSFALWCRPDWNGCKALAAAVVNASQPCPASLGGSCALGVRQPVTSQQMYALTGEMHRSPHGNVAESAAGTPTDIATQNAAQTVAESAAGPPAETFAETFADSAGTAAISWCCHYPHGCPCRVTSQPWGQI